MKKIRILIADDHAIVRTGLSSLLGTQKDFTVVGGTTEKRRWPCRANSTLT